MIIIIYLFLRFIIIYNIMSKLSNANISLMYENLSVCAHNQSLSLSLS